LLLSDIDTIKFIVGNSTAEFEDIMIMVFGKRVFVSLLAQAYQQVNIPDVDSLIKDGFYDLFVVVANSYYKTPYTGTSEIELEVQIVPKPGFNYKRFGIGGEVMGHAAHFGHAFAKAQLATTEAGIPALESAAEQCVCIAGVADLLHFAGDLILLPVAVHDRGFDLRNSASIGCGLCVSTCPTKSLSLVRKSKEKQPYVPKDIKETNIKLGKAKASWRRQDGRDAG
jgi:ferredoxin